MDRESVSGQRFTQDEMSEIIETAARLDRASDPLSGEVSYEELRQIANELGISDEAVLAAVAKRREEEAARAAEEAERAEERRKRAKAWRDWRSHLAAYIAVIGGLFLLNFVTAGFSLSPLWAIYPAIGWGMGLGVHTLVVLFNADDDEDD